MDIPWSQIHPPLVTYYESNDISGAQKGYLKHMQPLNDGIISWGLFNSYLGIVARHNHNTEILWNFVLSSSCSGLAIDDTQETVFVAITKAPNSFEVISLSTSNAHLNYAYELVRYLLIYK